MYVRRTGNQTAVDSATTDHELIGSIAGCQRKVMWCFSDQCHDRLTIYPDDLCRFVDTPADRAKQGSYPITGDFNAQ